MSQTVRQRAVPTELQGRVGSVYMVGLFAGLIVGQGLGGVIAEHVGSDGAVLVRLRRSGITLAAVWRKLAHIAAAPPAT